MADVNKAKLLVISGPSGSGKSTLTRMLIKAMPGDLELSVSATTRSPGEDEFDGKDYYFMNEQDFLLKVNNGEFLEYAKVFGNYYGTLRKPVMDKLSEGKTVVLEIDVQGAQQVFERFDEAVGILILPPGPDELRRRLVNRGRDDEQTIARRLAKANWEVEQAEQNKRYKYRIINDVLTRAFTELKQVVEKEIGITG